MKYGIVSDIHGNLVALQAVLADMPPVDALLCSGDIVGYGPRPNECCDIARERFAACIRGNHDRAVIEPGGEEWFNEAARAAILWTREALSTAGREFLSGLADSAVFDGITLMHGSLLDPDEYITSAHDGAATLRLAQTGLSVCGHTHVPEAYALCQDGERCERIAVGPEYDVVVQQGWRVLANCGSVGQPRDGDPRAAYALWDTQSGRLEVKRVAYSVQATQVQMLRAGLPYVLAARLAVGL
jgi:diadenosine tetraphosphatase ApaH/serine/threonine PP2A family protein phosphatase